MQGGGMQAFSGSPEAKGLQALSGNAGIHTVF
jgi:hypothetical protein